ncbi:MAG: hypothetical protein DI534_07535 [Leifsonia xyli]|nr:MAG: hypothetical protein DI534_07535 [Leifsonia xyli]
MDPRVALLITAHDQTHRNLAQLTKQVQNNHVELGNRVTLIDVDTKLLASRVTAEFGLVNAKLDGLERDLATVKDHVFLMTGKFGEVDKKVTLLDEKFTTRFDANDARLDKMDARFDGIDQRLDKVDARLDAIDQRLDGIDARLDTIVQLLTDRPRE